MLVGIDASRSISSIRPTGVEAVSDELIREIEKLRNGGIEEKVDFVFYASQKISWLPEDKQKIFGPKKLWTVLGLSWEMLKNRWQAGGIIKGDNCNCRLRERTVDVLFVPVHTLPWFCPKKTYKIIHDIAFKFEPRAYGFWQRLYLNFDLWRCRRICRKVIVPTEKVKRDLAGAAGFDENKVIVVNWGHRPKYQISNSESRKNNQYPITSNQRRKQIVYIGRIEEKKNIINLIKAFQLFNKDYPEYKLILAGKPGIGFSDFRSKILDFRFIDYLGYISNEEKYKLLSESSALALVSKEEGFGLPILEAFDFELAVVASDIPALREVGGEACVYVNPDKIEEIAAGLKKAVGNEELRAKLINKSRERLKEFDWERCAEKVLGVILAD